ncbi:RES family NAD+ phosphorylase [Maricaulis sp.]|uniref:RES family NAD+ phosphorylase n=1 Tax=Maricaulis sp. TaxID=1486257 RepID=UPI003A8CC2FC
MDEIGERALCHECIGDEYLSVDVRSNGERRTCHYCEKASRSFTVKELAERVEQAFEDHFIRTSDQPTDLQFMMLRDRESSYDWDRDGEPVVWAITNSAEFPEAAARDIHAILEDRFDDFEAAKMGEETEFAEDSYYEERGPDIRNWRETWDAFEHSLKTNTRFFNQVWAEYLSELFADLAELNTSQGDAVIFSVGPEEPISELYRARVFQAEDELQEALGRPDLHLGPPPSRLARAGRMNAWGISMFYGATTEELAQTEVRPPVGAYVVIGRFKLTRTLRLLDLTALKRIDRSGSFYDPDYAHQVERAAFFAELCERMSRPVMPNDEVLDYLPTQVVADFLASTSAPALDGIIYPSAQGDTDARNVALFHKASRCGLWKISEGVEIEVETGRHYEGGWEREFEVIEWMPEPPDETAAAAQEKKPDPFAPFQYDGPAMTDADAREVALELQKDSVRVHCIRTVSYIADTYTVRRYQLERTNLLF